jgi:hypothetical protein
MPRILLTLIALTTAIAFAAGCGNDRASSADAESLAPASSVVYGEATLRPEGDQRAAIDELVSKFPGEGSAGDRIGRLMEKAFESEGNLSYKDDVEPWLGDEAAFFVSKLQAGEPNAALLVATEDEDAAVDSIEKEGDARETEHRGRTVYEYSDGEGAAAVVDGWLVVGNRPGVRDAIDTAEDGDALGDQDRYRETLEDAPDERLGFIYVNMPVLARQLEQTPESAALLGQLRQFFEEPLLVTAQATEHGVRLESTVPASLLTGIPGFAEGTGSVEELPASSWLAFAQPDLGKTFEGVLEFGGVRGSDVIEQQFRSETGLDLQDDVISWMGDWSLFVRGTSVADLDGAMVVETSDEAASGRFIDAVARLARENAPPGSRVGPLSLAGGGDGVTFRNADVPQPIHLFQRDGKVVAAYGDAAADAALDPGETLADSPAYSEAQEALGEGYAVSFFLAFAPIWELVEAAGAASSPDWREAKPYLEPLGALASGTQRDGDKVRSAFGLTVD